MKREDISKFTNAVILISKLFMTTDDRFLKQKLHGKISDFVSAFVEQKSIYSPMSHNVAHQTLLNSINNLIDFLEHLVHTSKTNTTPLLVAQRNLLRFKLHILQQSKKRKGGTSDIQRPSDVVNSVSPKPSARKSRLKVDSNKERIFNYIKKTPDARARDVMTEFSALSGRTVKRSLKELTDEGFLKKISDGAAVYYLATD